MAQETRGGEERQIVVFSLGSEEFGVRINEVREIIRAGEITRMPNTAPYVRGVINLRGSIIVVIDLAMRLGLPTRQDDTNTRIIVIEIGQSIVGMVVDSATEVLRLPGSSVQPPPPVITERIDANYIEGVGIIKDRLLILLDLAKVLESHEVRAIAGLGAFVEGTAGGSVQDAGGDAMRTKGDHPVLRDVHHEYHFITHEGKPIANIPGLLEYIRDLPAERFQEFVNEEKNDFYNWVKFAVRDDSLAEKLRHITSKEDVTREIMDRILHVRVNG